MPQLWSKYTDYRVNRSSRAPHGAMRDILRRDRRVLRHMFRRNRTVSRHMSRGANRSRLNARSEYGERENN